MGDIFNFDDEVLSRKLSIPPDPFDDEPKSPERRRSSVYRRMSIPFSLTSQNLELIIPSNYANRLDSPEQPSSLIHPPPTSNNRCLHDFVPVKVLGQGAYGKVHLVQDRYTKKLYAQKQLRKPVVNIYEKSVHTSQVKRTIYEKQILSNITHHNNIVKLFYALQDDNKFYLILEYIPGGELFHHLTANNSLGNVFKEDDVAFYSAQMALGLAHLHKLGIVYRDLKPENCLLNSAGHLVLTDFGLSKDIGDGGGEGQEETGCKSIIGTPEYMAPEILKGESYDYAVDWWSLGCVIYDMMSGKPPFTGNSHKAIQDKILKNKLKLPYYFSMDAKDLLNKLLNKTPEKRFNVDSDWNKFINHRFFRKIDWNKLETQDIKPPIVPVITDPILAENFSPEFTGLKVSNYNQEEAISEEFSQFEGFSYTASSSFINRFS